MQLRRKRGENSTLNYWMEQKKDRYLSGVNCDGHWIKRAALFLLQQPLGVRRYQAVGAITMM
jgi:hypothetical protein